MLDKECENIQPGNAELERKGVKHINLQICVLCLSTRSNFSRDVTHTQPVLANVLSILANF
jgi:hypothetical protein